MVPIFDKSRFVNLPISANKPNNPAVIPKTNIIEVNSYTTNISDYDNPVVKE